MSIAVVPTAEANPVDFGPLCLQLAPAVPMTQDQFFDFCQQNPEMRFERTAQGELIDHGANRLRGGNAGPFGVGAAVYLDHPRRQGQGNRPQRRLYPAQRREPLARRRLDTPPSNARP